MPKCKAWPVTATLLHHFSEDPSITRFEPHIPESNRSQPPAVWAIDTAHAPLYWFPRACPRVTAWPRHPTERADFSHVLGTAANRLHAIEGGWLERLRTTKLFRYDFDARDFAPWIEASGQWVSNQPVDPVAVTPMSNLLTAHIDAGIELRLVANLWPLVELVKDERWDFSLVRLMNAKPPETDAPVHGS